MSIFKSIKEYLFGIKPNGLPKLSGNLKWVNIPTEKVFDIQGIKMIPTYNCIETKTV